MNNIELTANIAEEIVKELFGFIPVFQEDNDAEMYTMEGQDYFNRVYDIVLTHLDLPI
jgi:hypothetical protein